MQVSWEELGGTALARQFPDEPAVDAAGVAEAVRRTGPVQSQTARSPYVGLAARFTGVTHEAVSSAYEVHGIVRGSTVRGTVHTCTPEQHALLEVATRRGQRALWRRSLGLDDDQVEALWRATEDLARDAWLTPADLYDHLRAWVAEHGPATTPKALDEGVGRYLGFGHGGLVRRPLSGSWSGQGAPGYRTAAALLGPRDQVLTDPHALDDLVRLHLAAHGPASRHDLAWWAGVGLTPVDESLARLDLPGRTGPDGRTYVSLPDGPGPVDLPGVRLVPEFDALMCAYDPAARLRFMTAEHTRRLWNKDNGMVLPPIVVDGRITGYWRAPGTARTRPLEVVWFSGTRKPRKGELAEPVARLEAGLGITVSGVTLTREAV